MTCRICGNAEGNALYRAREMMLGTREEFTYFQCRQCLCLQIETIPADLAKYYPTDYNGFAAPRRAVYEGVKGFVRKARYAAALFPNSAFAGLLNSLMQAEQYEILGHVGVRTDSRILDVGCGQGSYLYPLYELGMKNVQGVDPFIPDSLLYPNGYKVEKKFLEDVSGQWDVLIFNHSYEHVPDPLATMQAAARLLADQGTCLIRIPTVSSYAWEHYRTDWFQLDAPRHLYLHSVESMTLLAGQAGLKLIDVRYDSDSAQFVHSEKYKRNIAMYEDASALYSSKVDRKLKKMAYQRQAEKLNQEKKGDQAAFILQKQP